MSAAAGARPEQRPDRRRFVQGALALPLGARIPRLARPSDELRVAVAGLNGRGAELLAALRGLPGARVVALCDVDDLVLAREARKLREADAGARPGTHVDLRRALERADVDAVVLATPNHWHALQTIWALDAGKDVYVESPGTHSFAEGAAVLAALERSGRLAQGGFQARSSPALREALEWLRAGNLGATELVRALCYDARPPIGKTKGNKKVPEHVDYDLWCGPAPLQPLRRGRLHHDWRWFWATGDGELGNRAAHALDLARSVLADAALADAALPETVVTVGGRFAAGKDGDDGQTPDTLLVHYAFRPAALLLEVRGLPAKLEAQSGDWSAAMDDTLGVRVGAIAHCEQGTLRLHCDGLAIACDDKGEEIRRWQGAPDPLPRWLAACASRRADELSAPLAECVRSAALAHLGNAVHRAGSSRGKAELVTDLAGVEPLAATGTRLVAHLEQNGIDLEQQKLVLGGRLKVDVSVGRFEGNERANRILEGSHREPFELPGG